MIRPTQLTWAVPITFGALVVALTVAVIIARPESLSSVHTPAAQVSARQKTSAQGAPSATYATYGAGLTHIVPNPVASLRSLFGDSWRELGQSIGRVLIHPTGTPSRYFELGVVTLARRSSARLEVLTSEGQRAIEFVKAGHYRLTNYGPLIDSKRGPVGLAFTSVQPQSAAPGANVVISPLQAEYLTKGQWVTGIPALAEVGPDGLRGVSLASGSTTRFEMAPGIRGSCELLLQGAGVGGALRISVTVGAQVRSAIMGGRTAVVHIGRFSRSMSILSLSVSTPVGRPKADLFIHDMRFVAASK